MRIGLFLGDTGAPDALVQQVVDAERDGFASAWFSQIFGCDSLTVIALAGKQTSKIEMGTSVVPVYPRHPHMLAQQALTVQAATNGRVALGIGLSHAPVVEGMWGMSYDHPARYMREYLSVLVPLMREGKANFQGEVFRVNATLQVVGATPPALLLAALAPAMLKTAGELADGTVTWMTGAKTIETHVAPRIGKAAKEAGRPTPRIAVCLPVAVTDDVPAARERAAQLFQVYGFLPNYKRMLDKEGASGPKDVVIVGNEADVEQQVRALASAGATDFAGAIFPAGDDVGASMARTHALLKGLIGKV
jgi:F420-dependent oxidoreductase-like protein